MLNLPMRNISFRTVSTARCSLDSNVGQQALTDYVEEPCEEREAFMALSFSVIPRGRRKDFTCAHITAKSY